MVKEAVGELRGDESEPDADSSERFRGVEGWDRSCFSNCCRRFAIEMESAAELKPDDSRFDSDSSGKYRRLRVSTSTPRPPSDPSCGEAELGDNESWSFEVVVLKSVKSCVRMTPAPGGPQRRGRLDRPLGGDSGEESGALDCCEFEGSCLRMGTILVSASLVSCVGGGDSEEDDFGLTEGELCSRSTLSER